MSDKVGKLNKRLLVALIVVVAVIALVIALGVYYGGKRQTDKDDQDRVRMCVEKIVQQNDCAGIAGLLKIEDKVTNKNEKCACLEIARSEIYPRCFVAPDLPQHCLDLKTDIWDALLAFYQTKGSAGSELNQCKGLHVKRCDALTITIPYKCYTLYESEGGCIVERCINDTNQVPSECPAADVDTEAIQHRTVSLYGSMLYCASHEMRECGVGIFPLASTKLCSRPWIGWNRLTNEAQKCLVYEAFLVCTAYEMVVSGIEFCGFETLHQNILADTSQDGHNPTVCGNATVKFRDMDKNLPASRADVCNNTLMHHITLKYHCTASSVVFAGTSSRDKCMSEMARKKCLLGFFGEAKLACTDESIRETCTRPEVRDGIFELEPGCEDMYPCVTETLRKSSDSLQSCTHGLVQFLRLASMGVDINHASAKNSSTEKLKCRIWNVFSACAMNVTSPTCQSSVVAVQSSLQILVSTVTQSLNDVPVKVNTFDECPQYSGNGSACPVTEELLYSTLAQCGYMAMKSHRENATVTEICQSWTNCASDIKANYVNCAAIDDYFSALLSDDSMDYVKEILGFDCSQTA